MSLSHHPHPGGTTLKAYAVAPESHGLAGGAAIRVVGQALVNPDRSITVWLDALPVSGVLVLCATPGIAHTEDDAVARIGAAIRLAGTDA